MKRTVRAWFLMLAFVATYVAAAAPKSCRSGRRAATFVSAS